MTTLLSSRVFVLLGVTCLFLAAGQSSVVAAPQPNGALVRKALESAAAALKEKDAEKALQVLIPIDAVEPDNPWLWFYRGQAHNKRNDPHKAMAAFDRALEALVALGDPDPEFASRIRVDRRAVLRQVFHYSMRLSLLYDSNVTFSGGGTTGLFITGRGDEKFASQLLWEYAPIATPEEWVTIGGRLDHAWHFSIDEFNYQDYGAFVRYTRRLDDHWRMDLQYDYDISYLDDESFLSNHALTPSLTYRWQPTGRLLEPRTTTFEYRIEARDFLFRTVPEFDRDGFTNSFGIEQTFRFRPMADSKWVWDLYAGYRLQRVATEGSEFDRLTNSFYLGVAIPVKNRWMPDKDALLQLSASWEIDDYRYGSLIDLRGRKRDDVITTVGLAFSQELKVDPDRGDLILHFIVSWTDSDSNIRASRRSSPFSYDKIVAGIQFEWRF